MFHHRNFFTLFPASISEEFYTISLGHNQEALIPGCIISESLIISAPDKNVSDPIIDPDS